MTLNECPVDEAEASWRNADKYYEVTIQCMSMYCSQRILKAATILFAADKLSGIHDVTSSRFLRILTAAKLIKSLS
jgi:hypothetical protein